MIRTSVGAALVCAMITGTTHAGLKQDYPIVINLVDRTAAGGMGTTFNSPSRIFERMGCYIFFDGDSTYAVCEAVDVNQVRASCFTTEPNLLTAIRAMNGDAVLKFAWVDDGAAHICARITVINASYTVPKK